MKTKSLAMLAISTLLTTFIAGAAPALADDFSSDMPMEQTLADNSSAATTPAQADNSAMPSDGLPGQNNASQTEANVGSLSSSSPSEEGTPDTATGDDDY